MWQTPHMNIYLLKNPSKKSFQVYKSAVVFAENEKEARQIHPDGVRNSDSLMSTGRSWPAPDQVQVILLAENVIYNQQAVKPFMDLGLDYDESDYIKNRVINAEHVT